MINSFYSGKKVFITGHTGFKGTWLTKILLEMGAEVCGYSLTAEEGSLFTLVNVENKIKHIEGDVRNYSKLKSAIEDFMPDIVFHLAAQPLVIEGYVNPRYTYEVNVMGTVNLLDVLRECETVKSVVNITTDKVYKNIETEIPYKEDCELKGYDPYSNSKSCSELVTYSYIKSFFENKNIPVSTCRAGNVIGGGDFADNRIIPDCVRAAISKDKIVVRNPYSVRPYQHVLEPLFAYLLIGERQYIDPLKYAGNYNIGPNETDNLTTGELVDLFCEFWQDGCEWLATSYEKNYHEANLLKLDCSYANKVLGWTPRWNIRECVNKTVEWYKEYSLGNDVESCMLKQIYEFWNEEK